MTYKRLINTILTVLGFTLLLGLILAAWLPPKCPVLNHYIIGCSTKEHISEPSSEQKELNRYPHSSINKSLVDFSVASQDYRKEAAIRFALRDETNSNGQLPNYVMTLQYKTNGNYQPLNLIYHPLLYNLDWLVVSNDNYRLYQRVNTYPDNTEWQTIVDNLPTLTKEPAHLAVDQSVAQQYQLKDTQYTPLETLNSLDNINYILTSYKPLFRDLSWLQYDRNVDLTSADTNDGQLHFLINIANFDSQKPLLLSQVHVDYRKVAP